MSIMSITECYQWHSRVMVERAVRVCVCVLVSTFLSCVCLCVCFCARAGLVSQSKVLVAIKQMGK